LFLGIHRRTTHPAVRLTGRGEREEVRHRRETIGKDGGLIIGPTHHVQLDTPMENFWAMVEGVER
jgi:hypothetical protein